MPDSSRPNAPSPLPLRCELRCCGVQLVKTINKAGPFVLMFDESLNQSSKKNRWTYIFVFWRMAVSGQDILAQNSWDMQQLMTCCSTSKEIQASRRAQRDVQPSDCKVTKTLAIAMAKYHEDLDRMRGRDCIAALENQNMGHALEIDGKAGQKVWRMDPDSIFDFDPVEDNIQSKSLHRMCEQGAHVIRQQSAHFIPSCMQSVCTSLMSEPLGDESVYSSTQDTASAGDNQPSSHYHFQQPHEHGYVHIHQTNMASPHCATMLRGRAADLYLYADDLGPCLQQGLQRINPKCTSAKGLNVHASWSVSLEDSSAVAGDSKPWYNNGY
ncbi:hypothetical protein SRHO_G00279980 [Serrasalmus rhombeus]